jgi:hypothetical protein
MSGDLREATRRRGSFFKTFRAVAWSFFGIRRSTDHQSDLQQLNPIHVIIAGVIAAAIFVAGLVFLVNWVVGSGVAK